MFDDPLRDGETVRWTYADLRARGAARRARPARRRRRAGRRRSASSWATAPRRSPRSSASALAGGDRRARCRRSRRSPSSPFMLERAEVASCSPRSACSSARFGDDLDALARRAAAPAHVAVVGTDDVGRVPRRPACCARPRSTARRRRHARRRRVVIFSSGTTSQPKGMLHSHRAADAAVLGAGADLRPPRADAHVVVAPDVLDRRAQHRDGLHPRRRRVLGDAGDLRARRGAAP